MVATRLQFVHPNARQIVAHASWQQAGLYLQFVDGCAATIPAAAFADVSARPPTAIKSDPDGIQGLWLHFGKRHEFFPWDWLRHFADAEYRAETEARMHNSLAHVGERVRAARLSRHWSQQALADSSELSRSTIARLEAGKGGVTLATLEHLADVIGVDFGELFGSARSGGVARAKTA